MPTATYDLLASNVLSSDTATITFSSISGSYRDLILVCQVLATGTNKNFSLMRFNSDTGSNYNGLFASGGQFLTGSGDYTSSTRIFLGQGESESTIPGLIISQIMDYTATNKWKPVINRYNQNNHTEMSHWRYSSTSAITSLTILELSGFNFAAGSTFHLYGIVS